MELQKLPEMNIEEVRYVVSCFYEAIGQAMIAHSSLSRFLYLRLMNDKILPFIEKLTPQLGREMKLTKFAVAESHALNPAGC